MLLKNILFNDFVSFQKIVKKTMKEMILWIKNFSNHYLQKKNIQGNFGIVKNQKGKF